MPALKELTLNDYDRRKFLLGSLISAAEIARAQTAEQAIGTGLIGVGGRGSYHLKTVLEQPQAKVVAVCDIKPDRLDKAASVAMRDKPVTFTDYRRMLERQDVQAVVIASPCDLHVEMAIAAIQAGKHVYCEKPIGITPESIQRLVRAAQNAKTIFQVGLQRRYEARLIKSIDRLREGIAGKLIMVTAQRHSGDDLAHDGSSADWFFNASRSGDLIVENAIHNLDICNWALGSRPELAAGFGGNLLWVNDPPGRTNMDGYTLSFDYANGVKMSFTQMAFHPKALPFTGQHSFVYGVEGAVDLEAATYYPRNNGKPEVLAETAPAGGDPAPHMTAFYESIRTGQKPRCDIIVGATAALTSILGREAIYRKKVLSWSDLHVDI